MGICCNCCKKCFRSSKQIDLDDWDSLDNSNLIPSSERSTLSSMNDSCFSQANLEDFKKLKVLGKGSFGKVVLVQLNANQKLFAMKVLKKKVVVKRKQVDHTKNERIILEKLSHPFIVKLYYAFQDENKLYFITEFMQGGELFFHLRRNSWYKDKAVAFYISEIILAIDHMHQNNFIYRDWKPENIWIDKEGHIKITDFGLSKILTEKDKKAYTICGTAEYLAPEILFEKGYDKTCDWFSWGVVIFEMLCGYHPFQQKNNKIDIKLYLQPIKMPKILSSVAKDLIQNLLETNPRNRLGFNGAKEIMNHKFFKEIDFKRVISKKYKPPFIPKLQDDYDWRYFDIGFTSECVESYENRNHGIGIGDFEGFSYQPPEPSNWEKRE